MKTRLLLSLLMISAAVMAQPKPEPADKVLKDAVTVAARENKLVMIVFHASWCGWCKKFDASVNDPSCKDYFDRNFVIRHLTVMESNDKKADENPGGAEMFDKFGGTGSGIPFFLVFDKKGTLLADSKMRPEGAGLDVKGSNMGCPAAPEEVAYFVKMLRKITTVTDSEAQAITERFSKNKN
ncbi:MAG: thioredoxin family protein [Bacteroidales bacterium]